MAYTPDRAAWALGPGGMDSNKSQGFGQIGGNVGGAQGIYETSTTAKYPLGARKEFEDGRVFRYAHFVTACTMGKVAAQDASATNHANIDNSAATFVDADGTKKDDYAAGDTTIYIRDSTVIASDTDPENRYAGGYFGIPKDESGSTGGGQSLRIKSSSAGDYANTSGTAVQGLMKLELYDGLVEALDSESECWIIGSEYSNLMPATGNVDAPVKGVTMLNVAAGAYAWILTRGVTNVLADGAGVLNAPFVNSDGVAGAVSPLGNNQGVASEECIPQLISEEILGVWLAAVTTAEYGPAKFRIE